MENSPSEEEFRLTADKFIFLRINKSPSELSLDNQTQEFIVKLNSQCIESMVVFISHICEEIDIKGKFMEAVRIEQEDRSESEFNLPLTKNQLRLFKMALDKDWLPSPDHLHRFRIFSQEGIEIQEEDLFYIRSKDVLYLELNKNDFNYGQILDQFRILQKIGQGGFGSVYKVEDRHSGQVYAMKTIKTGAYINKADTIENLFREQ
ncbi:unnamed protein product [Moneuplotes crassus]|uniref:Protein kinase domain-containing protein n=1 Tax=Euplotes crassus TaxID=5936 RepID=A0AAD2DAP6_EUPCR|nr:unnamed protein product [Moneuplotes crassus]